MQSQARGKPYGPTSDASSPCQASPSQQRIATRQHDNQGPASNAWADANQPARKARHATTLVVIREKEHTQIDRNLCVDRSSIHCTHNVGKSVLVAVNHWFASSPQFQSDFATEAFR